jgi:TetR/AcrR family transcriptional repressor of lmrAB and yxaGH operons
MPRPPTVSREEVIARMKEVFRANGYDGATLSMLSASAGLARSGLYHLFPEGKEQMAAAVLKEVRTWSAAHVLQPLTLPGEPAEKLHAMTLALNELYGGGHEACLIGLFSIGEAAQRFGGQLHESLGDLIATIEGVLIEAGIEPRLAHERAEDAVIRIQGSLVVSRVLEDTEPFTSLLRRLPEQLLGKGDQQ